jgi:protease IV
MFAGQVHVGFDGDRLTVLGIEMGRHPTGHDEERVVAHDDKQPADLEKATRLLVEPSQVRQVLAHQRTHHEVVVTGGERRGPHISDFEATVKSPPAGYAEHLRREIDPVDGGYGRNWTAQAARRATMGCLLGGDGSMVNLPGQFGQRRLLLELDLTRPLLEEAPNDPLGWLTSRNRQELGNVARQLFEAADDPRVAGVVAKLGAVKMPLAQVQELRDAVRAFRNSDRVAVGWAESFNEFGPGAAPYLLACAFDEIWLQPSGSLGLTGVSTNAPFIRGVLDRINVEPQYGQRYEYKNAADTIVRRDMSPAHREAASRLAESAYEQIVDAIAADRKLSEEAVRELIDQGPLSPEEAVKGGLVDRLGYRDEVYRDVRRRFGDAELCYLSRYRRHSALDKVRQQVTSRGRPVVAFVQGTGMITTGNSGRTAAPGGLKMGSDTVSGAFRSAVRDPHVRAIVFRVDSPGGSYVGSDTIWREVCVAREAGKPVVVSMGAVAASGGYFVSMAADAIVAQPGTLTGSIGVLSGKFLSTELFERAGLHLEPISIGRHAQMFSSITPYSEEEWERLNGWLDRVYVDFTTKVAQGRGLTKERVHELARGRVWTGSDAKEHGLVDELGGVHRAAELARERAGLPAEATLKKYPAVAPVRKLRRPKSSEDRAAVGYLGGWGEFADIARVLQLPLGGPLTMQSVELRL